MPLSYWPADISCRILDITAGDALRAVVQEAGERTALVEVMPQGMALLVGANKVRETFSIVDGQTAGDLRIDRHLAVAAGTPVMQADVARKLKKVWRYRRFA